MFNVILKVEISLKAIIQIPIKNEMSVYIITVELALCDHFGSDRNRNDNDNDKWMCLIQMLHIKQII